MYKKIILAAVTFGVMLGVFLSLARRDSWSTQALHDEGQEDPRPFVTQQAKGKAKGIQEESGLEFQQGEHPRVRIFDEDSGRLKYELEAKTWAPSSKTAFHLTDLVIQLYSPRGQMTYIRAKEADVTLAKLAGDRFEPQNGKMTGGVTLIVDKTTSQWRQQHPELSPLERHPEDLIQIEMQEATFDLQRAEVICDTALTVNSVDVRLEEVSGLTLQWNQVDNRIDRFSFKRGGRMTLYRGGEVIDFALPGAGNRRPEEVETAAADGAAGGGPEQPEDRLEAPAAQANMPVVLANVTAAQAAEEMRSIEQVAMANAPTRASTMQMEQAVRELKQRRGQSQDDVAAETESLKAEAHAATLGEVAKPGELDAQDNAGPLKVDTYRALFEKDVTIRQEEGSETLSRLEADHLEINFDFSKKQRIFGDPEQPRTGRRMTGQTRESAPVAPSSPDAASIPAPPVGGDARAQILAAQSRQGNRLVLTWSGSLELMPLRVPAAHQTGQRFDAVAIGSPVRFMSKEGQASCRQLVYRHQQRQVWLAGTEDAPADLRSADGADTQTGGLLSGTDNALAAVPGGGTLVGREIYFDRERNLAHIDGAGYLLGRPERDTPQTRRDYDQWLRAAVEAVPESFVLAKNTARAVGLLRRAAIESRGQDEGAADWGSRMMGWASGEPPKSRPQEDMEIHWTEGVHLELAEHAVLRPDEAGRSRPKRRNHIRRAWFNGDVVMRAEDQTLSAEQVAATFEPPTDSEQLVGGLKHLNLQGEVHLADGDGGISANKLDVEMTEAADGRVVPETVDAEGDVLVRQSLRQIKADRLHALMWRPPEGPSSSGEAFAGQMGVRYLEAEGNVSLWHDDQPRASSQARLDQWTRRGERYTAALKKSVQHGGRLWLTEFVLCEWPRIAREDEARSREERQFAARHDVVVRQADSLKATLRNGRELVDVRIVSPAPTPDRYAFVRFEDTAVQGHRIDINLDRQSIEVPGPGVAWMMTRQEFGGRKLNRPTPVRTSWSQQMQFQLEKNYGVFVGTVHSESGEFAMNSDKLTVRFAPAPPDETDQAGGAIERIYDVAEAAGGRVAVVQRRTAGRLVKKRPVSITAEGHAEALSSSYAPVEGGAPRLLNRSRIAGERMVADLVREQMSIPGPGSLLIEDYQFEPTGGDDAITTGPLMSSLRSEGPSQTLITWENAMDFFVDRSLAAFDQDVLMHHLSGQEMVLQDNLARAMNIDVEQLKQLDKGRRARLSCGHLLVEFLQSERATDLKRLIAQNNVQLQEGTRHLLGEHLEYHFETNIVRLEGSDHYDAQISEEDAVNQRYSTMKFRWLVWDRNTNRIETPRATMQLSQDGGGQPVDENEADKQNSKVDVEAKQNSQRQAMRGEQ